MKSWWWQTIFTFSKDLKKQHWREREKIATLKIQLIFLSSSWEFQQMLYIKKSIRCCWKFKFSYILKQFYYNIFVTLFNFLCVANEIKFYQIKIIVTYKMSWKDIYFNMESIWIQSYTNHSISNKKTQKD